MNQKAYRQHSNASTRPPDAGYHTAFIFMATALADHTKYTRTPKEWGSMHDKIDNAMEV